MPSPPLPRPPRKSVWLCHSGATHCTCLSPTLHTFFSSDLSSIPSSGRSLSSSATTSVPSSPGSRTSSTSTTVAAGARGSLRVPVCRALCRSAPASGRAWPLLPLPAFAFLSSLEEDLPPLSWASLEELRALWSILNAASATPGTSCWQSRSLSFLSGWGGTPGP